MTDPLLADALKVIDALLSDGHWIADEPMICMFCLVDIDYSLDAFDNPLKTKHAPDCPVLLALDVQKRGREVDLAAEEWERWNRRMEPFPPEKDGAK